MASYHENSFTISLQDYALNKGKTPADFDLETIVVVESCNGHEQAIKEFNKIAKKYEAVIGMQEWGSLDFTSRYYEMYGIRGTGVKAKKTEQK